MGPMLHLCPWTQSPNIGRMKGIFSVLFSVLFFCVIGCFVVAKMEILTQVPLIGGFVFFILETFCLLKNLYLNEVPFSTQTQPCYLSVPVPWFDKTTTKERRGKNQQPGGGEQLP